MKQFLYLDTDIVNSIIAQSENGIATGSSTEVTHKKSDGQDVKFSAEGQITAGGAILKLAKAEADLSANIGIESLSDRSQTNKEITTKILHDAAFDIAIDEIKCINIEEDNHLYDNYGNYIRIKREFEFIDLDYLQNMFSEKGFIEFLKQSAKDKIEKEFSNQINSNFTKNQAKAQKSEINSMKKELIKKSDNEYDTIQEIISILRQIIPYSKMLISSDGYLIPLEDKYFRVDSSSIGFRYGGSINCVGMVSNIIKKDAKESQNVFTTLQNTINTTLHSVLSNTKENICVIHPIGVYYEN